MNPFAPSRISTKDRPDVLLRPTFRSNGRSNSACLEPQTKRPQTNRGTLRKG